MQLMHDLSSPLSTAALGTLDFSLLYDQENNALHCTISKAKVGPLGSHCSQTRAVCAPWRRA